MNNIVSRIAYCVLREEERGKQLMDIGGTVKGNGNACLPPAGNPYRLREKVTYKIKKPKTVTERRNGHRNPNR